jgi:hypothetical protein
MQGRNNNLAPSAGGAATAATATNLRWRARIAKEAMAFPFDDSSTIAFDDDALDNKSLKSAASQPSSSSSSRFRRWCGAATSFRSCHALLRRRLKPVIVPACVAGAIASSLYALTVSTHVVVALASALTVAISVIVLIQQHLLHAGGSVQRSHVAQQTQALHNLQVQKERLYRQVLQLDETAERRRDVQRQLQVHVADMTNPNATHADTTEAAENDVAGNQRNPANGDIGAAMRIAALYKETATTLLKQSQNDVAVAIAKAMVRCLDADGEGTSAAAEEALLTSLNEIQGVAFDEKLVRQYLTEAGGNAESSTEDSSITSVWGFVNLLRQAMMDGELAAIGGVASAGMMDGTIPGTPQRRKRRLRAQQQQQLQKRKQLSAVFVFDPDKRIKGSSSRDEV